MMSIKKLFLTAVLSSAVLFSATLSTPVLAQKDSPRQNSQFLYAFRDATAEASKSTVRVMCDDKEAALGTIVSADGYILTKYSEIAGKDKLQCQTKDEKTYTAKIVGVHEQFDLAMLKVDAKGLTPVKFVESKTAPVGNWVASAGTGDDPVAVGVMSVAVRKMGPRDVGSRLNPKRGFLGIQMEPVEGGVRITNVTKPSPADKAGLKMGDVILSLNGKEVTGLEGMQELMSKTKSGDTIALKIKRGDEEKELKATLDKAPMDRGDVQNNMGSKLSDRRTGFPMFFQHDTVIEPKDCGGPIVDLDGKVLGVNIARAGRTESYAIPSEALTPILADLKSGKLAPKADPVSLELDKKIADLKAAMKAAEAEKAAAEKKIEEAKEELKKQEAEKAAADKKLKDAKDALDKAEKEKNEKK